MKTKLLALSVLLAMNATAAIAAGSPPPGDFGAQHAFPEGLKTYTEDTTVSNNGRLYQCKKFPFSGFCSQWSPSTTQYEPGVGIAWTQAWIDITPVPVEGVPYDVVFPEYLPFYQNGVVVKQDKDGGAYRCNPFPNEGFCQQWSEGNTEYEPGVGFAWEYAWTYLGQAGEQKPAQPR